MRKHPLIALTALTAAGTSAFAGAATHTHFTLTRSGIHARRKSAPRPRVLATALRRPKVTPTLNITGVYDLFLPMGVQAVTSSSPRSKRHAIGRPAGRVKSPTRPSSHTSTQEPSADNTAPVQQPASDSASAASPSGPAGGAWLALRECESGDNYAEDSGNGYYGAYQFALSTWYGLGFTGLPSEAPPAVQDEAAAELQARSGWGQWPACSAELGL